MVSPLPLASWFKSTDLSDCDIHVMTTAALAAKNHTKSPVMTTASAQAAKNHSKPPNLRFLWWNRETASIQGDSLQNNGQNNGDHPRTVLCDQSAQIKVYPSHRVVLKSSSAFFLARITERWQQSATYEMTVESEEDMPAAELVIKYMYTKNLVQDLPLEQLLRILSIADQFQVYHLSDICAQRINAQLAVGSLCWDGVLLLIRWSHPFLKERLEPGMNVALDAVLKRFLDLEKSWGDGNERAQFLQLPFQAVAWLLAQPTLKVASENTVAVAIDAWLTSGDLAAHCNDTEKAQLWRLVRGGSLGSHFLSYRLPQLPTFQNLPNLVEIHSDIIRAKTMPSFLMGSMLEELRTADVFKPQRPVSDRTFAFLNLAVSVQELTAAFDKVSTPPRTSTPFSSDARYFAGYFWKAWLMVDAGGAYDNNHKHCVVVTVHVDEKATMPAAQHYGGCSVSLTRLGQDSNCTKHQYKHHLFKISTDASFGWYGVMGADWQALAQDGMVHLGVQCTAID